MIVCAMNFTGKTKLTNEEFMDFYEELWEKTSHRGTYPQKSEIEKNKAEGEKRYNSLEKELENEMWQELPNSKSYKISTAGRVKYNDKIILQYDTEKTGYLRLDKNENGVDHTVTVYTLVAKAFLGKTEGDGYDVHHIINNGYDNRPCNLILLTREQHNAVHSEKKYTLDELRNILKVPIL